MRGINKYIAALGILLCTEIKPVHSQILIPEELQAANNITLLQSAGSRLWVVQLIAENSGVFTYSLSSKFGGVWKRLPAFKVAMQSGKNIEFTDVEVYHDRIYLSGNFVDVTNKNNCLTAFDLLSQKWITPYSFAPTGGGSIASVNTMALCETSLFFGGSFQQVGNLKLMHMGKITKGFTLEPVRIKTAVGSGAMVIGMESDALQKTLYISGYFRNILGTTSSGFCQFRVADSAFLKTPLDWGMNVLKMRMLGSKLVYLAEDSNSREKKIYFLSNTNNVTSVTGIDSVFGVVNFFSNKDSIYFTGDAQPELDVRSYGIFRISEFRKSERVFRQFNKVMQAEGFEGNIYVFGYFVRVLSSTQIKDNFNFARIDDNFKRFYGRVFHDKNVIGKYEPFVDVLAGGNNVAVYANGTFQFMIPVERSGYFSFIVPAKNTVTYKAIIEKTVELKTTSNYIFRTDTFNERLIDFPVQYLSNTYSNVRVNVTAAAGWQCRKDTSELYVVRVLNTGLVPVQPDVVLDINGKIQAIQSDPAPFQIDPGTTTKLTWKLSSAIQPGSESIFMIKLTAPSDDFSDSQQLDFNASVANFTDNNPADNTDTLQQTVTTSLAANTKFQFPEIPSGENFAWIDPDAGKIEYIIRFTNVTDDTISTVVVRDTISTPDYVTYIQETGSSHPFTRLVYTTPYLPNKVIVAYTFSNLKLPPNPSGNSEVGNSSGYVGFRLGLKQDLVSGTNLNNRASIYLDNEEPFITEWVSARVSSPTTVFHPSKLSTKLVYPNPFDEILHFKNVSEGEVFQLYSVQGKLLVETIISDKAVDLKQYNLSSGAYIWSTVNPKGEKYSGIVTKN
jgi:hypothetical protein